MLCQINLLYRKSFSEERDREENGRDGEVSSYLTLLQFVTVAAGLHDLMSPEGGAGEAQSRVEGGEAMSGEDKVGRSLWGREKSGRREGERQR